jgi:type I restriction enzyme S subunit
MTGLSTKAAGAWLDNIPSHWVRDRLKAAGTLIAGSAFPEEFQGISEGEIPFYKVSSLGSSLDGKSLDESPNTISLSTAKKLRARIIPRGAVVYAKIGAALLLNRRRMTTMPCCIDNNMTAFVPDTDRMLPEWAFYFLSVVDLRELANPGAVPSISEGYQSTIPIVIPPVVEQKAIAAFLDRETAKIDALVAKKRRLIELLQERRTALITHVVTRGLDPTAPMSESGVEWLGPIPARWEVRRLRHVVKRIEQGWSPECESREAGMEEWGVLKAGCVNGGTFVATENKALPVGITPLEELEVRDGDLLMSRASGSRDLVGSVAVVSGCRPRLLLCDKIFRLHTDDEIDDRRFLAYALNSRMSRWQVEAVLSGGSGLANNIAQGVVKDLVIPRPEKDEQRAIVAYLDELTARIDELLANIRSGVDLLTELRTALVSAAVTGKIDVRGEAA